MKQIPTLRSLLENTQAGLDLLMEVTDEQLTGREKVNELTSALQQEREAADELTAGLRDVHLGSGPRGMGYKGKKAHLWALLDEFAEARDGAAALLREGGDARAEDRLNVNEVVETITSVPSSEADVTITKIDPIPDFDQSHVYLSDGRVLLHFHNPEHHDDRVEGRVEVGSRLATTTVLDDNTINGEELTVYHFVRGRVDSTCHDNDEDAGATPAASTLADVLAAPIDDSCAPEDEEPAPTLRATSGYDSVRRLGLRKNAITALEKADICNLGQLISQTPNYLLSLHQFGSTSLDDVLEGLDALDIDWPNGNHLRGSGPRPLSSRGHTQPELEDRKKEEVLRQKATAARQYYHKNRKKILEKKAASKQAALARLRELEAKVNERRGH